MWCCGSEKLQRHDLWDLFHAHLPESLDTASQLLLNNAGSREQETVIIDLFSVFYLQHDFNNRSWSSALRYKQSLMLRHSGQCETNCCWFNSLLQKYSSHHSSSLLIVKLSVCDVSVQNVFVFLFYTEQDERRLLQWWTSGSANEKSTWHKHRDRDRETESVQFKHCVCGPDLRLSHLSPPHWRPSRIESRLTPGRHKRQRPL